MTDTVVVYEHPLSPYAQKIKLALREKNVAFEALIPGFGTPDSSATEAMAFADISPRQEVPVLVHNDQAIFESPVILAYIEETWTAPALLPNSATERARVRVLENVMDTQFEANTWGLGEVLIFGRAEGQLASQLTQYAQAQIQIWFSWLDQQLGARDWFNGQAFGYADLCVVPHVNAAGRFEIFPDSNSALGRWLARANKQENVAKTQSEALAAELDPTAMQAALAAGFQREYRDHRLEWMIQAGGMEVVTAGLAANNIRFNNAFS